MSATADFKKGFLELMKAFGLVYAGIMASSIGLIVLFKTVSLLAGGRLPVRWLALPIVGIAIAVPCFVFLALWLRFRGRLKIGDAGARTLLIAGFAVLPLLAILSLPPIFLGIRALAPMLFDIALPLVVMLLVSETTWLFLKAKLRSAKEGSEEPARTGG